MNKKTKEPIYRDTVNGKRWRFISVFGTDSWMMMRVKDGYRSVWSPSKLVLEK